MSVEALFGGLERLCRGAAKYLVWSVGLVAVVLFLALPRPASAEGCPQLLRHNVSTLLDETPTSLCQYEGKVLLVVNTASYCGFTPQYEGLEKLHAQLAARGLVVLGFPANDFGRQEPGSNKDIAEFCANTYGVKFPMFSKTVVTGGGASPFYKALAARSGKAPGWNFHKYLIDRSGRRVLSFDSQIAPDDRRLLAQIDAFLAARP